MLNIIIFTFGVYNTLDKLIWWLFILGKHSSYPLNFSNKLKYKLNH